MLQLANNFAAHGHQVDFVVSRAHGPLRQELSPSVRLVTLCSWRERFPWGRRSHRRWWLTSLIGFVRYLQREQPAAVLATSYFPNIIALSARALVRVPSRFVIRVSNHLSETTVRKQMFSRQWRLQSARLLYPQADAVIAVSAGVAEDVARVTSMPRERIAVIDNPVLSAEIEDKANSPLDHPSFAPGSPPVILAAGRFVQQKDFPTLLRAFARVRAVRPVRLIILGEGRQRQTLTTLISTLNLTDEVSLPGFVQNPFPYMAHASVFVLSSVTEGFPGVLVEAMACGCPVVSTDCPSGPAEILEGGIYGPLVPVGNEAALADAILSVLNEPPDPHLLRERVAQFSVERAADRYLEILLGESEQQPDLTRGE